MSDSVSSSRPGKDATKLAALRIAIEGIRKFKEGRERETKREARESLPEALRILLRLIEAESEHQIEA